MNEEAKKIDSKESKRIAAIDIGRLIEQNQAMTKKLQFQMLDEYSKDFQMIDIFPEVLVKKVAACQSCEDIKSTKWQKINRSLSP